MRSLIFRPASMLTVTLLAASAGLAAFAVAGPTAAGAASAAIHRFPAGVRAPAPRPPGVLTPSVAGVTKSYAYNWSGYAQNTKASGTFTAVKDNWKVPTVNTTLSGTQYSSDWVGIDGFSNSTLVQCGTEADNINHTAVYRAWTEILPAPEVVITGLAIHPGDKIWASVQETSAGVYRMLVKDLTTGRSGGKTVSYSTPGKSAEAVHERPSVNGRYAALAKTSKVTFDPGSYSTAAPGSVAYKPFMKAATGATVYRMFMINNAGTKIIAAPSLPDADIDGFAVAYGATSPAPPAS